MADGKTVPELNGLAAPVQDADLFAAYRAPGPLQKVAASALRSYVNLNLFETVAELLASTSASLGATGSIVTAGGYRYEIVTSGEHLTTAGGVKLVVLPTDGKYYAEAFGIVPGAVNVTTFKTVVVIAATAGLTLAFGSGTFTFGGSNITNNGLLTPGNDIGAVNIEGVEGFLFPGSTIPLGATIFENIGTAHYGDAVRFRGVTFRNCVGPIYMTGNVDSFAVSDCRFLDCRRSMYHNDDSSGVYAKNGRIVNNYFQNTAAISDFSGAIIFHKTRTITDFDVIGNMMVDLTADATTTNLVYCIAFGNSNFATDTNKRIRANNNTIIGCGNHVVATPTTSSFGVLTLADDSEQNGNIIRDGGWINALYMKGHQNRQVGNTVHNPEWAGVTMKVTADTSSRENLQANNVVTGVVDREGAFRMFGRAITIGNQAFTTATAELHPTEGGWAYFVTQSSTHGPLYIQGQFNCPRGIKASCAGDVTIDVNLVSAAGGVDIQNQSGQIVGSVDITGKIECQTEVMYVGIARQVHVHDLEFKTNASGAAVSAFFANTQDATTFSNVKGIVTDTAADSVALGYVVSLFTEDGAVSGLTNHVSKIEGFSVSVFRPLLHFSRTLSDTNLIGKTVVALRGVDVDLQGETCTSILRAQTNTLRATLDNVSVIGTPTRTVDGSGITITDLVIQNGLLNYVTTDNLAGHTNVTATRHRIRNNTNLLPFSVTVDFPSLATNASSTIATTTVTGAALGNRVTDTAFSIDTAGVVITAWVSAADTVSYYATNVNGTNPLDLASGTLTGIVRR